MKQYHCFLFDLDNTLWDFDTNARDCIAHLMQEQGLSSYAPDPEAFYALYKAYNDQLWILYERGEITQEKLRERRFAHAFTQVGIPNPEATGIAFGQLYLQHMPLYRALKPHAIEVLDALQQKECKMGIISNGFRQVQYGKIRNSGLEPYFGRRVFISEEIGYHKPNPKIFRAALTALNAKKTDTLMVGDNFANDIEGAQVFGIDQFYYNPKQLPCDGGPTFMGATLLDLIPLAGQ